MNFDIRPQDFQKTWTTAYQCAIINTFELQTQIGIQLQISKVILNDFERLKKSTDESMQSMAETVNLSVAGNTEQCVKKITSAGHQFERAIALLTDQHIKSLRSANDAMSQLNDQKRQFKREVKDFYESSFWGRLKFVFGFQTKMKEYAHVN